MGVYLIASSSSTDVMTDVEWSHLLKKEGLSCLIDQVGHLLQVGAPLDYFLRNLRWILLQRFKGLL